MEEKTVLKSAEVYDGIANGVACGKSHSLKVRGKGLKMLASPPPFLISSASLFKESFPRATRATL